MPLSGLLYLRDALKRNGVDPDALPAAALRDRVELWIGLATSLKQGRANQRAELVRYLEGDAQNIAVALIGQARPFETDHLANWLSKHEIVGSSRHRLDHS